MKNTATSPPSRTDSDRVDRTKDEDIDFSDLPEIPPEMFARAIVCKAGLAASPRTVEDLLQMPRDDWRYELIEGVLNRAPPPGFEHGSLAGQLGGLLFANVNQHHLGRFLAAETGFQISSNPDTVRAPDVAFVSKERLQQADFDRLKYFPGAPDFLVEVLSPADSYSDIEKKVAPWLAAGARLVVLADPARQLLFAHRPGRPVQILSREDTLDASDVVSGWRVRVSEIFSF